MTHSARGGGGGGGAATKEAPALRLHAQRESTKVWVGER